MLKQIPNALTLCNLLFGCLAIVQVLDAHSLLGVLDNQFYFLPYTYRPENIYLASLFIGLAAVVDFFDGFVARWLKTDGEMGKQLDSLADIVSFGVAPSCIVYQFLKLSFAQQSDVFTISFLSLLPAFFIALAAAYRLARFNVSTATTGYFIGVPTPAVGIVIAAFPLIYWYAQAEWIINILHNVYFWYGVIFFFSYLMIARIKILSLKQISVLKSNKILIFVGLLCTISTAVWLGWVAVFIGFILYIILSLHILNKKNR